MKLLPTIRFAVLALVLLFSVVELALCAKDIHVTKSGVFIDNGFEILMLSPFFFPFAAFGLAVSVLTIVFVVPIIVVDVVRKGAITSVIAFELIWTGILWILWLAVGGDATAAGIFSDCQFEDARVNVICHQFPALQGLAFFNWLLLFGWWITLGIVAFKLRRQTSNTNLWRQSVVDARFTSLHEGTQSSSRWWRGRKSNGVAPVPMKNYRAKHAFSNPAVDVASQDSKGAMA